jgi:hypothetical protein
MTPGELDLLDAQQVTPLRFVAQAVRRARLLLSSPPCAESALVLW